MIIYPVSVVHALPLVKKILSSPVATSLRPLLNNTQLCKTRSGSPAMFASSPLCDRGRIYFNLVSIVQWQHSRETSPTRVLQSTNTLCKPMKRKTKQKRNHLANFNTKLECRFGTFVRRLSQLNYFLIIMDLGQLLSSRRGLARTYEQFNNKNNNINYMENI